ncbi:MAG: tyrosine-type recombinase/integrase [Hyphomicrobium sp.]
MQPSVPGHTEGASRSRAATSFGNWFRKRCREAGLTDCPPHGLRKAAATRMAESGVTTRELMAWFGWMRESEAERYTRAAEKKRLTMNAAEKLSRTETGT